FFSFILRPPPGSTLLPTRRSSDLAAAPGPFTGRCRAASSLAILTRQQAAPPQRPLQHRLDQGAEALVRVPDHATSAASSNGASTDRKSTRLNSSHGSISYAVFCLK